MKIQLYKSMNFNCIY